MSYRWRDDARCGRPSYSEAIACYSITDDRRQTKVAWLELVNYPEVGLHPHLQDLFSDTTTRIVIGSKWERGRWCDFRHSDADRWRHQAEAFSVADLYLDPGEIIRFQKAAVRHAAQSAARHPLPRVACAVAAGLSATSRFLDTKRYEEEESRWAAGHDPVVSMPTLARELADRYPPIPDFRNLAFVPCFPRPKWILEEPVAKLPPSTAYVEPLERRAWNTATPFDALLAEWDSLMKSGVSAGYGGGLVSRQVSGAGQHFHHQLEKIRCLAFRGETRNPQQMKDAGGFLPGITRDYGFDDSRNKIGMRVLASLDESARVRWQAARKAKHGDPRSWSPQQSWMDEPEGLASGFAPDTGFVPDSLRRGGDSKIREYVKTLLRSGAGHLGSYIDLETGGLFVSFTRSLAVTKSFIAGYQAALSGGQGPAVSYCYAADLRGGLNVPLKGQHTFAVKDEQEVAFPGAVFWSDVLAFRACEKSTGRLKGPVWLRANDMAAPDDGETRRRWFDLLFAVLSGKNQNDQLPREYAGGAPW